MWEPILSASAGEAAAHYPMLNDDSSRAAEREENAGLGRQFAVTFHSPTSMTGTFSALHRKAGAA
jgi:hypothetical protein